MSLLRPSEPSNSRQYRPLDQPHIIARASTDQGWSAPVRYVRGSEPRVLISVLAFLIVSLIVTLMILTRNNKDMRQTQVVSRAAANEVDTVSQHLTNTNELVANVAQKQDTSQAKLTSIDNQVQNLQKRVATHDRAIRDLKGRASLPADYNPRLPLTNSARIHYISPSVRDWTVDVAALARKWGQAGASG